MPNLILYMTETSVSLAALYCIYWLFMRRDTFFAINRIYLIGSILLAVLVPFFRFEYGQNDNFQGYGQILQTITIGKESLAGAAVQNMSFVQVLLIIWITGVFLFTMRLILQLFQLFHLVKRFGITRMEGLPIVFTDNNYAPFSFFKLVFLNRYIEQEDAVRIIAHEKVHARQMHSADIIILELVTILQWFNPFVWLYRYSLKAVHEFLADEGVLQEGEEKKNYQELLLSITLGAQVNDISNNFNHSLIKRRFIMMTKIRSNLMAKFKLIFILPLAVVIIAVLSCQGTTKDPNKPDSVTVTLQGADTSSGNLETVNEDETVYDEVEEMPQFPGGDEAMMNFMIKNVVYPQKAKENGITGKVFVSFTVTKTGKVTDVKIKKGANSELDAEALRVVKMMPDWKPGKMKGNPVNVFMTLPVSFKLS
jgi:TonB family protein